MYDWKLPIFFNEGMLDVWIDFQIMWPAIHRILLSKFDDQTFKTLSLGDSIVQYLQLCYNLRWPPWLTHHIAHLYNPSSAIYPSHFYIALPTASNTASWVLHILLVIASWCLWGIWRNDLHSLKKSVIVKKWEAQTPYSWYSTYM